MTNRGIHPDLVDEIQNEQWAHEWQERIVNGTY